MVKTLPVLKSSAVVVEDAVAFGIVNLKRLAVISPEAMIEVALAAPILGVINVGVFSFYQQIVNTA